MRVYIDGEWEPSDFADFMIATHSIYYIVTPRHEYLGRDDLDAKMSLGNASPAQKAMQYNQIARTLTPTKRALTIRSISYSSPGSIDFAGLGASMDAVRQTLESFLTFFTERRLRRERDTQAKIQTAMLYEDYRAKKLENLNKIMKIRTEYPAIQMDDMIDVLSFAHEEYGALAMSGKIRGISTE